MTSQNILKIISETTRVSGKEAQVILDKAVEGREINGDVSPEYWLKERLLPNIIFIDEAGYTQMCIDALKIVSTTAGTDFGSSRQRDFGQLWADMTRGYLGEYAFKVFLENKFLISCQLDHEIGRLEDYLPTDIHNIKKSGDSWRKPKLSIGVKAAKWNGIWFDIPGDQFSHSDIHVLVKVGTGRDHLFAFFKQLSVFKDKVLKRGEDLGCISKETSAEMFSRLPDFNPIPAYVCGFVKKSDDHALLSYQGKKGNKHYTIAGWCGPIKSGDLEKIKQKEKVLGNIKFSGIGAFAHENGYLFNTGSLLWTKSDWEKLCSSL